ncbi:MAG: AAA family ATPase, partial [Patescibacteria group bacterium]
IVAIFRGSADLKLKVKSAKEKSREENQIFNDRQIRILRMAYLYIVFSSIVLMFVNWYVTLLFIGVGIAISAKYWWGALEVWRSFQHGSLDAKHVITGEKTTFSDVGGLEEIKGEIQDTIELYKDPKDAEEWDIRPAKGILLVGPPGNGKTLLARAIAGEAGLTFIEYSAAEVGNSYVRSGAQATKGIFDDAQAKKPALLFLDEIDALGRRRGYDVSGEYDHALTELLHQMDGIRRKHGVLVVAATNREDVLDEALVRPGRFDKKLLIPPPNADAREQIRTVHTKKKRLADDVNLHELAKKIAGFNGATIEQLTNEATQAARRRYNQIKKQQSPLGSVVDTVKEIFTGEKTVTKADFENAILTVQLGPARKAIMSEKERKIVAVHEIGHAVVTAEKDLEILEKVMLMPRNWALGITVTASEDNNLPSRALICAKITSLFGGRAAEEVFLNPNEITTGAGNDLEKAEELARKMVSEWGMGELGPTVFLKPGVGVFSREYYSEYLKSQIDQAVQKIKTECYEDAKKKWIHPC